jgi:hypothetical protein
MSLYPQVPMQDHHHHHSYLSGHSSNGHQSHSQSQFRSLSSSSPSESSLDPITPPMPSDSMHHLNMSVRRDSEITNSDDQSQMHGNGDNISCKWQECQYRSPNPEDLYEHLCNAHVGRKSTNNLCLTCAWEGCGVKCVKRDHITSHLRGKCYTALRSTQLTM